MGLASPGEEHWTDGPGVGMIQSAMIKYPARVWRLALFGAVALAARADDLPPLNSPPGTEQFGGKFIWADLFTADPAAASRFYTSLFGWEATSLSRTGSSGNAHSYIVLSNEGRPVAGIALRPAKMEDAVHGRWVGYVSVKDVPQALAAATSGGGRILFPARSLPQQGIKGIFIDPDGAELGVMNSSSGDPAEYTPESGDWTWSELFARDPVKAGQYYKSVAGYDVIPDTRTDRADTLILVSGGYSRAGVLPVPNRPKARPAWLLFVRVASVKDTIARVVALGGRVLLAPSSESTEYWKAIIADPAGAVLGIVQLETPAPAKEQP